MDAAGSAVSERRARSPAPDGGGDAAGRGPLPPVGLLALLLGAGLIASAACGDEDPERPDPGVPDSGDGGGMDAGPIADGGGDRDDAGVDPASLPYARNVVELAFGDGAGFGQADLPEVVLGPPQGRGPQAGSLDVLSLGVGGTIVLDFGPRDLVDGPGPDLVVFENPFWVGNDPTRVFAELGEVAVSLDGTTWSTFACDPAGTGEGRFPGCAGWTPTLAYDQLALVPLDPMLTGGDTFDLEDLGLERARYVRIRDLAEMGAAPSAGFDLDAVGAVHLEPRSDGP